MMCKELMLFITKLLVTFLLYFVYNVMLPAYVELHLFFFLNVVGQKVLCYWILVLMIEFQIYHE